MTRKAMLTALSKLLSDEQFTTFDEGLSVIKCSKIEQFILDNISTQERQVYDYVIENDSDGVTTQQLSNYLQISQHHASGVLKMLYDLDLIYRIEDPNGFKSWLYVSWDAWKGARKS